MSVSNVINGNVPDTGLIKGSVHAIIGRDGYSAYELALKHGFVGTEEEWLLSLNGVDGTVEFDKLTPAQKESLKGEAGVSGVYVGSGDMPVGYNVQIDPNGNSLSPNDVYHTGNKPTAADIGSFSSKGYITDNSNVDNLADGVYQYNGWASGVIVCSAGLPFTNAMGIWIKKTPFNETPSGHRNDTVINCQTGDVYTMFGYDGTWHKNAASSVNKGGDIMDGELRIAYDPFPRLAMVAEGAFATMEGSKSKASLQAYNVKDDPSNRRIINLYNSSGQTDIAKALELVDYKNDAIFSYNILHTGNKPSGSYTGNGSGAERTIDIGGIGKFLIVQGNGVTSFVSNTGATLLAGGGITSYLPDTVKFQNGVLTLATNHGGLNGNGIEFAYQVL